MGSDKGDRALTDAAVGGTGGRLILSAGPHRRTQAPLEVATPSLSPGGYRLTRPGESWPAQVAGGHLLAVVPNLPPGAERTYEVAPADLPSVVALDLRPDRAVVTLAGQPWTTLRLEGAPKPFLFPLLAPGGVSVVRGWPIEPVPGDSTDHPHHRGAWIGHGDVNGMDAWEENPKRLGRIRVVSLDVQGGPVAGHADLRLEWVSHTGETVAREQRTYRFWSVDGQARLYDVVSVYAPVEGRPLRFGDTKEGALCGVRVATGMEGRAGGRITTAEGAVGEREAWGSSAGWCDYSGVPIASAMAGRAGETVGVAIFDHPNNPLHPTRWHVRDYGLMTANPFALSHYRPGQGLDGAWSIPGDGTATFRFRMCVHRDDAAGAEIARRYSDWAFPVRARWEA